MYGLLCSREFVFIIYFQAYIKLNNVILKINVLNVHTICFLLLFSCLGGTETLILVLLCVYVKGLSALCIHKSFLKHLDILIKSSTPNNDQIVFQCVSFKSQWRGRSTVPTREPGAMPLSKYLSMQIHRIWICKLVLWEHMYAILSISVDGYEVQGYVKHTYPEQKVRVDVLRIQMVINDLVLKRKSKQNQPAVLQLLLVVLVFTTDCLTLCINLEGSYPK